MTKAANAARKLKITFLILRPTLSGGARVVAKYAELLQARGHEVAVIGLGPKRPTLQQWLQHLRNGRIPKTRKIDLGHFDNAGVKVTLIDGARDIEARDAPDGDVVIATWWNTAEWVAALPASKGAKAYLIQGLEASFPFLDQARAAATYDLPLRRITVSHHLADELKENYGCVVDDIIPNAVDTDQFKPLDLPPSAQPTVGFLYSGAPSKNIGLAVETCKLLKAKEPALRVISFGKSAPQHDICAEPWVDYTRGPSQSTINELYNRCDVWLFTSDYEGFGLPILEAMACGTPVVATRAGASPQLVTAETGVLVDERTPQAVAAAALSILNLDESARARLARGALETARRHSWKNAGDRFEQILLEMASTPPAEKS